MATAELDIVVESKKALADIKAFAAETQKAASAASKSIEGIKSATDSIASGFTALKGAAVAALGFLAAGQVKAFFDAAVEGAAAEEAALKKLDFALQLTGDSSKEALEGFSDFADELERTTKLQDDQVLSALALAKSFNTTNEEAQALVKAASELAAVTGKDLDSAVRDLGGSLSGVATRDLAKLIPAIKGLSKEALVAGDAIKLVQDRFGGSASAEIDTFAGRLLQAEKAFENFQKAIGQEIVLNPAVNAAIEEITKAFGEAEDSVKSNSTLISDAVAVMVVSIGQSAVLAAESFGVILTSIDSLVSIIPRLNAGFRVLDFNIASIFATATKGGALEKVFSDDQARAAARLNEALEKRDEVERKSHSEQIQRIAELSVKLGDLTDKIEDRYNREKNKIISLADIRKADDRSIVASTEKVKSAGRAVVATLEEQKAAAEKARKAVEDVNKFLESLATSVTDPAKKIQAEFRKSLDELDKFEKEGLLSKRRAEEARAQIASDFADKSIKLNKETADKLKADLLKAAEETRAEIQKIIESPLEFVVKSLPAIASDIAKVFEGKGLEVSVDADSFVAAGASITKSILDGAEGAKSVVSKGIGSIFGQVFGKEVGDIIGGIVGKFAEGPDATKKFVREFVDALPEIIDNVIESVPAFVEAFVDVMVNRGGAVRIAVAIAKAMAGVTFWGYIGKQIGKEIGVEFGDTLNASNIGDTFTEWGEKAGKAIEDGLASSLTNIQNAGFKAGVDLSNFVKTGFADGARTAAASLSQAFREGGLAIIQPFQTFFAGFGEALSRIAQDFGQQIFAGLFASDFAAIGTAIGTSFLELIGAEDLATKFADAVKEALGGNAGRLLGADIADGILNKAKEIGEKIAEALRVDLGGGGGGGGGGVEGLVDKVVTQAKERPIETITGIPGADSAFGLTGLDSGGGGVADLLLKILAAVERPITTTAKATLDGRAFADIILTLNRQGQRLTA